MISNGHGLSGCGHCPPLVIVPESFRVRHLNVIIQIQMVRARLPVPVRCLVLAHEHERLVLVPTFFEPLEGKVSDDVCGVTFNFFGPFNVFHWRVVIGSLPQKNSPFVKTSRISLQVPFSEYGCLISFFLQKFGKGLLRSVEPVTICHEAVQMAVLSCQNDGAAGSAYRVGNEAIFEPHSLRSDAVDVGCFVAVRSISADRLVPVVIREDEEDVGSFCKC